MILTYLVLFSFLDGASGTEAPPAVVAETYSGGWTRSTRAFRDETESERKARIHADRIRLGIIAPDEQKPTALERAGSEIAGGAATLLPREAAGFTEEPGAKPAEEPEGFRKRIDKLTRAKYDAEREAAYWRGKAEGQAPEAAASPEPEARPKQDQYASYEEYIEAVTDWKLTERLKTERARMEQESQAQTVVKGFEAQVQAAREQHADFDAVVYNQDLQISETRPHRSEVARCRVPRDLTHGYRAAAGHREPDLLRRGVIEPARNMFVFGH